MECFIAAILLEERVFHKRYGRNFHLHQRWWRIHHWILGDRINAWHCHWHLFRFGHSWFEILQKQFANRVRRIMKQFRNLLDNQLHLPVVQKCYSAKFALPFVWANGPWYCRIGWGSKGWTWRTRRECNSMGNWARSCTSHVGETRIPWFDPRQVLFTNQMVTVNLHYFIGVWSSSGVYNRTLWSHGMFSIMTKWLQRW